MFSPLWLCHWTFIRALDHFYSSHDCVLSSSRHIRQTCTAKHVLSKRRADTLSNTEQREIAAVRLHGSLKTPPLVHATVYPAQGHSPILRHGVMYFSAYNYSCPIQEPVSRVHRSGKKLSSEELHAHLLTVVSKHYFSYPHLLLCPDGYITPTPSHQTSHYALHNGLFDYTIPRPTGISTGRSGDCVQ